MAKPSSSTDETVADVVGAKLSSVDAEVNGAPCWRENLSFVSDVYLCACYFNALLSRSVAEIMDVSLRILVSLHVFNPYIVLLLRLATQHSRQ